MIEEANLSSVALLRKIGGMMGDLSRAEQRVANYVLKNPKQVISQSVAELADHSSVSDATVIRACRSLGFVSYQDFKLSLIKSLASPLTHGTGGVVNSDDPPEVAIEKVFEDSISALQLTHNGLSSAQIIAAARKLKGAKRILIIGLGGSNSVAHDMHHKLLRLGLDAHVYTDDHLQLVAAINCMPGDVVFAISHSGSSVDIVECAKLCKKKGAEVISLSNTGKSPLSKVADISLTTVSRETQYHISAVSSRIAQLAIIDCLHVVIALETDNIDERYYEIDLALKKKKY